MWTARNEKLAGIRGLRFTLTFDSRPAAFEEVVRGWETDPAFRVLFNGLLADAPYTAFRWEIPAVTEATLSRAFEFVLLDSPNLSRRPEPQAFAEHFTAADRDVAVFPNLGANALMIAPHPVATDLAYGHLAAFARLAPEAQRDALWQTVGQTMRRRIGTKPVWLSTAGAGVSWLHVRLDDQPKYYGFEPYRRNP